MSHSGEIRAARLEVQMKQGEANVAEAVGTPSTINLPLWRLYTLRLCYLILAAGLGTYIWPSVFKHTVEFAAIQGIQTSLLAGLGAAALLGLRYPAKMIPLLLFELIWKTIYLAAFALPAWRAHQITESMAADISSVLMVVVFVPLIPWGFVWREYAAGRGERIR